MKICGEMVDFGHESVQSPYLALYYFDNTGLSLDEQHEAITVSTKRR